MLISEISINTKSFLSLDTVYVKIWIYFVAFFSSLFHFPLMQRNFPLYCLFGITCVKDQKLQLVF